MTKKKKINTVRENRLINQLPLKLSMSNKEQEK